MSTLRITLLQTDLAWQSPALNFAQLEPKLGELSGKTDLIVLPEMFSTGFTDSPESIPHPEQLQRVLPWLQAMARKTHSAIYCSSPFCLGHDQWVNRGWFVSAQGDYHHYDKAHLFCLGGESHGYLAGNQRTIIHYRDWRILLTICYDLRFPTFCRNTLDTHNNTLDTHNNTVDKYNNTVDKYNNTGALAASLSGSPCSTHATSEYDLMLCVANWPQSRRHAWTTLLSARAIENQAYVVGVNRIGKDGKGLRYCGDSLLIDYNGKQLLNAHDQAESITTVIDTGSLKQFRQSFPFLKDADQRTLTNMVDQTLHLK